MHRERDSVFSLSRNYVRNNIRKHLFKAFYLGLIILYFFIDSAGQKVENRLHYATKTLGFSKIYVISTTAERIAYASRILDYHKLEYTFLPSYGPYTELVNSTMSRYYPDMLDDFKQRGKVGCWASHREVWKKSLADEQVNTVLILEDDIDVRLDIKERVKRGWLQLPSDWQYYLLGLCYPVFVDKDIPHLDGMNPFTVDVPVIRKINRGACLHSYGVRRTLLPELLEWSKNPSDGIDLDVMTGPLASRSVQGYTLWPFGMIQRPLTKMRNSLINNFASVREDGFLNEDWRRNDVFREGESTAEKVGVAYWY